MPRPPYLLQQLPSLYPPLDPHPLPSPQPPPPCTVYIRGYQQFHCMHVSLVATNGMFLLCKIKTMYLPQLQKITETSTLKQKKRKKKKNCFIKRQKHIASTTCIIMKAEMEIRENRISTIIVLKEFFLNV